MIPSRFFVNNERAREYSKLFLKFHVFPTLIALTLVLDTSQLRGPFALPKETDVAERTMSSHNNTIIRSEAHPETMKSFRARNTHSLSNEYFIEVPRDPVVLVREFAERLTGYIDLTLVLNGQNPNEPFQG